MRGDQELGAEVNELVDAGEQCELAHRRERRLRLVEDVEAIAEEAIEQQREECLAVRLLVQRYAAISSGDAEAVDLRRYVEERLGAQEVAVRGIARRSSQMKEQRLFGFIVTADGFEAEVLRAAFLIESGGDGQRLDDGRLARSVLADEEGDRRPKLNPIEAAHGRDIEAVVARSTIAELCTHDEKFRAEALHGLNRTR